MKISYVADGVTTKYVVPFGIYTLDSVLMNGAPVTASKDGDFVVLEEAPIKDTLVLISITPTIPTGPTGGGPAVDSWYDSEYYARNAIAALTGSSGNSNANRYGVTIPNIMDNLVYVGCGNTLQTLNLETNTWATLANFTRLNAAMADAGNGFMVACGGGSVATYYADIYEYSVVDSLWVDLEVDLNLARYRASAVGLPVYNDSFVLIAGGVSAVSGDYTPSCEILDRANLTCTAVANLPSPAAGNVALARPDIGAMGNGHFMYVYGQAAWEMDPAVGTWTALATPPVSFAINKTSIGPLPDGGTLVQSGNALYKWDGTAWTTLPVILPQTRDGGTTIVPLEDGGCLITGTTNNGYELTYIYLGPEI